MNPWIFPMLALVLVVIAPVLDRFVFPEKAPGEALVPQPGQVFRSDAEGVLQRVVKREGGLIWIESTLRPYAPGPPLHIHRELPERFRCERGVVSMQVGDRVVELHAGEEFLIEPGTPHRPFNATGEEAVVRGLDTPEYALPERFGVFLSQIYGFIDAKPENQVPPRVILQMSRFGPYYDTWLADKPVLAQQAMFWVLGPIARVLGFRNHYAEFAPREQVSGMVPAATR